MLLPHQARLLEERLPGAIRAGHKRLLVVSPTGSGKTIIAAELADRTVAKGNRFAAFTHRRPIFDQIVQRFRATGQEPGLLAAGHRPDYFKDVQVGSFGTVNSRILDRQTTSFPIADLVIVDEAHSNTGTVATATLDHYERAGAIIIGLTATPVGCGGHYDTIVDTASYSELRAVKFPDGTPLLVPCRVFAPSEPDTRGFTLATSEDQFGRQVEECHVENDIYENWLKTNPDGRPTAIFPTRTVYSRAICKDIFGKHGLQFIHIDGSTPDEERRQVFRDLECGDIEGVSSVGVLREGWDCPSLYSILLLTPCVKVSTYMQIAGRELRGTPGKDHAVLLDFVGAWWRHGAPDQDREWELDDTDKGIAKARKKALESGEKEEGIRCPKCSAIRPYDQAGQCPSCGWKHKQSTRNIRTAGGELKLMRGRAVKRKRKKTDYEFRYRNVEQAIYASCNAGRTVKAMKANYRHLNKSGLPSAIGGITVPPDNHPDNARLVSEVFPQYAERLRRKK